eukprot:1478229-Prymnesium_polylepis.1
MSGEKLGGRLRRAFGCGAPRAGPPEAPRPGPLEGGVALAAEVERARASGEQRWRRAQVVRRARRAEVARATALHGTAASALATGRPTKRVRSSAVRG